MDPYGVSARAYLGRAKQCLSKDEPQELYYAAFELRCGVEARLQEYLSPHEFVPDSSKIEWRVGRLHQTALRSFQLGEQIARLIVRERDGGKEIARFYYTPVPARLKQVAEMLGNYLHASGYHSPTNAYWEEFRGLLDEGVELLTKATFGTMLGPLMRKKGEKNTSLPIELVPDINGIFVNPLKDLVGSSILATVSYHDSLEEACAGAA